MPQQANIPPAAVPVGKSPPAAVPAERHPPASAPPPASPPPVSLLPRRSLPPDNKDGFREIVETIVFVVVLVLLLKTFLAEAFVIPTGSMATTLLGYHKDVVCEMCGYRFRVNASEEAEKRPPDPVIKGVCPNCRYVQDLIRHWGD
jgi:signal peptidase I